MNVVMISEKDYAGSGNKIATAVNQHGKHSVTLCVNAENKYKYPHDICLLNGGDHAFKSALKKADIIHFKGDDPPSKIWRGYRIPDVPVVISVGGSVFRRPVDGKCNKVARSIYPMERYLFSSLRTALTPDLNYPDFEGIYTQQCINSKQAPYTWTKPAIPILAHSPSHRLKKGTDIIQKALNLLRHEGVKFEFDLIENVSNTECIDRKKRATLFIDQISDTGFYGISALEAMQFGIPTMAYISDQAVKQAHGKLDDCPVLGSDKNAFAVYSMLKFYLKNISELESLSYLTKVWADKFHGFQPVGRMWNKLYNDLGNGKYN